MDNIHAASVTASELNQLMSIMSSDRHSSPEPQHTCMQPDEMQVAIRAATVW